MDASEFWNVIGEYNQHTVVVQIFLLFFVSVSAVLSYTGKIRNIVKIALGIINLYIGICFFALYGTEAIQKFFALPLYLLCGALFLYDGFRNREDRLNMPNRWQAFLLILYLLYPLFSLYLGNRFPQMVTHIMPCPVISLSITVYAGYNKKNKLLLALLTVWGLTGIKSVIFSAYEDIVLLICGIYGVVLLIKERSRNKVPS